MSNANISGLNRITEGLSLEDSLRWISECFPGRVAFSLGFGKEGMIIADAIFRNNLNIRVFTLDTGRLFPETHELFERVHLRYNKPIEVFFPNGAEVEKLVSTKGPASFYHSVDNRKECCHVRKVRPLERALQNTDIWISGVRAEQSEHRKGFGRFMWDDRFQLIKFHPLIDWKKTEVERHINIHRIPYNKLHDQGFVSIGCAPCTRAVAAGEEERNGRWWWESSKKECGLHANFFQNVSSKKEVAKV
ncbi:MAG: phosphoadenylyl-sulfate reductase [Bacteroidota bacterium]